MADFNKLKDTIRGAIYPNGRGAISADKHQAALLDMADTMQETAAQVTELSEIINGKQYEGAWEYEKGGWIDPSNAIIDVNIVAGRAFVINVEPYTGDLYWYINDTSAGMLVSGQEQIATEDITHLKFFLDQPTSDGVLEVSIVLNDGGGLIRSLEGLNEDVENLTTEIEVLKDAIGSASDRFTKSWNYGAGQDIYDSMSVDIPKGSKYVINVESYTGDLYWYINGVSQGFILNNTELIADVDITSFTFFLSAPTSAGTLSIEVVATKGEGIKNDIEALSKDVASNNAKLENLNNRVDKIDDALSVIQDSVYEQVNQVEKGAALNTTSDGMRLDAPIAPGQTFNALIDYANAGEMELVIYFYHNNQLKDSFAIKNKKVTEYCFDYDIDSVALYISAANAVANGEVLLKVIVESTLSKIEKDVADLAKTSNRYRFADALNAWLKGEKFAIGFHGDSTTDGVSTTGWSVENSHPAQDEAIGGVGARGVVDYVCELAYPKQLQNMLRAELKNDNLKIYNIGYYGASLKNNLSQLPAIYGGVYSDVKMVGIMLSINDRATETPQTYYASIRDNLVKYVEFFLEKGITPFMVTQQVVTQCGNNPNEGGGIYEAVYQDYIQTLSNKAKEEVAKMYDLEVIDMNGFGRLILKSSSYPYYEITEDLHFRDLGHRLEAGFLFSQLIPWVNYTDNAKVVYWGFNCANSKTNYNVGKYDIDSSDKFKVYIDAEKEDTSNLLIFDSYMFVNSEDGAYNVTYHTPLASGYIIIDNDVDNPIQITSTEQNIGTWDIGLHHIQVYTGNSKKVAFKGFKLDRIVE